MTRAIILLALTASAAAAQIPVTKDAPAWVAPEGWTIRLDDKDAGAKAADTRFTTMGSGFHVTSGPAALYYRASDTVTGAFTASAGFGQRVAPAHPEAYGLFIGGRNLDGPRQEYFYYLVRGDGRYFIAHRAGPEVHQIVPWTEHPAVNKQNPAGVASNVVAIEVTPDSVHMLANLKRVHSFAKSALHGFATDGQVGLRVNHGLNVHIGEFRVRKP
jgi:hypothetical protein